MAEEEDPLYRRGILRLAANAAGAGHLPHPDASATVHNPACGDRVTVELTLESDRISALGHTTQACILTQASAALLASKAPGRAQADLKVLAETVRAFLAGGPAPEGYEVFDGVTGHAGRHICVLLPLQAALKALEGTQPGTVGAEDEAGS